MMDTYRCERCNRPITFTTQHDRNGDTCLFCLMGRLVRVSAPVAETARPSEPQDGTKEQSDTIEKSLHAQIKQLREQVIQAADAEADRISDAVFVQMSHRIDDYEHCGDVDSGDTADCIAADAIGNWVRVKDKLDECQRDRDRLREALKEIADVTPEPLSRNVKEATTQRYDAFERIQRIARAALAEEKP